MAVRTRARSQSEFIEIINQSLDEIFDLRAAIEYDEDFMSESSIIVEPMERGLQRLLSAIKSGDYRLGEGDYLDFLNVLKNIDQRAVPFLDLLKLILDTHTKGYQEQD